MTPDTGRVDRAVTVAAMSDIFDRAGDGIFFTHSAGAFAGWETAMANSKVKAIVAIEPGGFPFPEGTGAQNGVSMDKFMKLTKIPIIVYFGDYIPERETAAFSENFWRDVLQSARQWAALVNSYGGDVTIVHLPEIDISGNTHFIMSDLNNQVVANHIADWLSEKRLK
ncbi:MAG: hypothetical protein LBQ37_03525 [Elusimicrobiota bacterium]|nr:hypothetical protein [Elusimicrobiota bacterium]